MGVITDAVQVAAMLRERIMAGELAPGLRLQQVPLSESLGVSRTPLREALAILAREGLLDYEPNRGYAVRTFSWSDIEQAYAVRARLEAFACHLCARQGLAAEPADSLQACLRRGDAILAEGRLTPEGLPPYRAMNVEFHETILAAAANRWITDFVRQTQNVPLASDRLFVWEDYDVIKRSHDDHHRIVHAILARDVQRAEALMREHIVAAGEVLERIMRESGS
jgi:GntR family transcriptional regulator of vanillate catabolism